MSLNADLGTLFFDTHLTPGESSKKIKPSATCPDGMTANLAFPGNSMAPGRFGAPSTNRVGRVARSKPAPMHFTFASPLYAILEDGALHTILQLSGNANTVPPVKVLPPWPAPADLTSTMIGSLSNCRQLPRQSQWNLRR